jgi:hypothetical protein
MRALFRLLQRHLRISRHHDCPRAARAWALSAQINFIDLPGFAGRLEASPARGEVKTAGAIAYGFVGANGSAASSPRRGEGGPKGR